MRIRIWIWIQTLPVVTGKKLLSKDKYYQYVTGTGTFFCIKVTKTFLHFVLSITICLSYDLCFYYFWIWIRIPNVESDPGAYRMRSQNAGIQQVLRQQQQKINKK
jgi:hypothetical protein